MVSFQFAYFLFGFIPVDTAWSDGGTGGANRSAYTFVNSAPNSRIKPAYDTHNIINTMEPAAPYVEAGCTPIIVCSSPPCFSQTTSYKPLYDDVSQIKSWDEHTDAQHKKRLDTLRNYYKSDFKKIYETRYTDLKDLTAKNRIVTDSLANNYLQQLVKTIFNSNPGISSQGYRIRFTRDHWPNAASMGEGTIIFNIGLFTKLQNESQVAFVLCHEIAHYHLRHSQTNIERYVNTINSKEYQQELRRIVKSEYQRGKQLESLAKGLTFNSRRHTREHESSARQYGAGAVQEYSFQN